MSKSPGPLTIAAVSVVLLAAVIFTASARTSKPAAHQAKSVPAAKATAVTPAPVSTAPVAPPGTVLHVVSKGELLPHVIRKYWASSSYMTHSEMEAAMRERNTGMIKGISLKPGDTLVIPGMEGTITQQPVLVKSDYEVRAIYLTGVMAGSVNGMNLVRRWREAGGNAVVFDVKDSDGIVNIPFQHPLNTGGPHPYIPNLPKYTRWLHQQGMHAIARIAIFRDEKLVTIHSDLAVQSRARGGAWRENGKLVWTDPSKPEVQQFNIALARQAALDGVDEVQFDYVRFPAEGDQKDAKFYFDSHPLHHATKGPDGKEIPAAATERSDVIVDFLSKAYGELQSMKVLFSLDVFGVMAWQRQIDLSHTGQDIPRMAKYCDVLSPMIYPSHFFGMDGYKIPGDAPEHFISGSMDRFKKITAGTGVVLRPWLQAFGWKTPSYSPQYVETQVKVSNEHGGIGFLFWNARNDYSKPFAAMPQMRQSPKFIRGDELPKVKTANAQDKPAVLSAAKR